MFDEIAQQPAFFIDGVCKTIYICVEPEHTERNKCTSLVYCKYDANMTVINTLW